MSETVNALEHRLSPERLKHEAKGTVHETIDEVRDQFHPRHMANRAGRSMMDTIKEHPVPALTAGLSLGYLFMKAGERSRGHRGHDEYRHGGHGAPYYQRGYYAEPESYAAEPYGSYYKRYPGRYSSEPGYRRPPYEEEAYARETGSGQEKPAKEQAKEKAGEVKERASQQARQVQQRTQEAGRRMQHGAHRAQSEVEQFVHDNPLAAGALAVGVGALLGNMFSSTEKENKWMGPARDEVTHRAEKAAQETMEQASQSAERVSQEAQKAAQDVKETAKSEAENVKEEGKRQAKEQAKQ